MRGLTVQNKTQNPNFTFPLMKPLVLVRPMGDVVQVICLLSFCTVEKSKSSQVHCMMFLFHFLFRQFLCVFCDYICGTFGKAASLKAFNPCGTLKICTENPKRKSKDILKQFLCLFVGLTTPSPHYKVKHFEHQERR